MNNFVDDYVVFDLETTGLDCNINFIIEIGALKYRNNELVEEFNFLINPEISLPDIIIDITGLTDEYLKYKENIEVVLPKFLNFIEDLHLIAHNNEFDLGFINSAIKRFDLKPLENRNIDNLEVSRKFLPQMYNHKLETLKKYFGLKTVSHRAIGDCYTTNYVYQECKKRAMVKK